MWLWLAVDPLEGPVLLAEVLKRDPIVKSSDSVSKTLPPEEALDSDEAEAIKFFMEGGEERPGGRNCKSSNSSAKSEAKELEADLLGGADLLGLGM